MWIRIDKYLAGLAAEGNALSRRYQGSSKDWLLVDSEYSHIVYRRVTKKGKKWVVQQHVGMWCWRPVGSLKFLKPTDAMRWSDVVTRLEGDSG